VKRTFLDCDGVLADFDALAAGIFGEDHQNAEDRLGTPEFYRTLREYGEFFYDLPLHSDALDATSWWTTCSSTGTFGKRRAHLRAPHLGDRFAAPTLRARRGRWGKANER